MHAESSEFIDDPYINKTGGVNFLKKPAHSRARADTTATDDRLYHGENQTNASFTQFD